MVKLIAGGTALAFVGGLAVLGAQQLTHGPRMAAGVQMLHQACGADPAAAERGSHVPEHVATMLALSPEQIAELEVKGAEACRLMSRLHAEMLQVLTPEQRARMEELHGGHLSSGVHTWLKRLHGR